MYFNKKKEGATIFFLFLAFIGTMRQKITNGPQLVRVMPVNV